MPEPTIQTARVGDRVYFTGLRQPFTVQARDERFVICTRRFAARRTVLYSVIDLQEGVRGTDNVVFGGGYETREDCEKRLRDFRGESALGFSAEVSHRNRVTLRVMKVTPPPKEKARHG